MILKWWGRPSDNSDDKIEKAQREVGELLERSDRVAEALRERLRRNHWGQTIAEIARGER